MDRQRHRTTGDPAHKSMFICSYVESKTETRVAKAKDYIGGGGHRPYFLDWVNNWGREGGGHRTYFVNEGNNWGGDTAQH